MRSSGGLIPKKTLEKLISILKQQLSDQHITDIIQVGDRELNIVLSTGEDLRRIKRRAEFTHEDSEIRIKGIQVNFVDRYGTPYENL